MRFVWPILYFIAILPIVPALMTLLTYEASKPNGLGYYSLCPFAPWSTLMLIGFSAVLVVIIRVLQKKLAK